MSRIWFACLLVFMAIGSFAAIPIKETRFISPVKYKVRLSGSFGELRGRHFHAGLDIKSSKGRGGDSIFSAENGYVARIRIQRGGYGKSLYIRHPNGYTTVYAHLDAFDTGIEALVSSKQKEMQSYEIDILPEQDMFEVAKGDHLAFLGNTGISYGPHLHFEIRETETDEAINPLLFGIAPYDKTAPVISSVRITGLRPDFHKVYDYKIPFAGRKKKQLKEVAIEVPAWRAGIAIAAHDLMDGSPNKHGLYRLEMWVDDSLYYRVEYDKFLLKETHLIDAHTRFEVAHKSHATEVLCYRVPGNVLSMVQNDKQRGLINLYKDVWRRVELRASDFYGNESRYNFRMRRMASFEPPATETPNILHGVRQIVKHKNLDVTFYPGSIARDISFQVNSGPDSIVNSFEIGNSQEPVLDGIRLTAAIPEAFREKKEKLYLARTSGRRPVNYGCDIRNDSITTLVTDFGRYGFMVDEKAPDIVPISFTSDTRATQFRFKIRDNVQSVGEARNFMYHVWIDDHWIPCEFRTLSETLTVPLVGLDAGEHTLKIEARDMFDNLSRWQAVFRKK